MGKALAHGVGRESVEESHLCVARLDNREGLDNRHPCACLCSDTVAVLQGKGLDKREAAENEFSMVLCDLRALVAMQCHVEMCCLLEESHLIIYK